MRFLTGVAIAAAAIAIFLRWARSQSEGQIDKMQGAVFNSPGAEAPVPPRVLVLGVGLLAVLWFFDRNALRLTRWQALSSLATGGAGGVFAIVRTGRI